MRYRARSLFLVVLVFVLVATGILAEMSVSEADELILTKDVETSKSHRSIGEDNQKTRRMQRPT